MTTFFAALLRVHLFCALAATAVFWIAGLSSKGGQTHRLAGRFFSRLIYAAAITGGFMAIADLAWPDWVHAPDPLISAEVAAAALRANQRTMWLVLYVLLIIVAPVQHGLAVVAAGPRPAGVRSHLHAALNILAMAGTLAMLAAIVVWQQWIFLIVMPIGLVVGLRNLTYASRAEVSRVDWEREHLTSMITAGVTLHTAFFVFGTSRTLGWQLHGLSQLLPWVLPALVGLPLAIWLRMRRQ